MLGGKAASQKYSDDNDLRQSEGEQSYGLQTHQGQAAFYIQFGHFQYVFF